MHNTNKPMFGAVVLEIFCDTLINKILFFSIETCSWCEEINASVYTLSYVKCIG